MRYPAFRAQGMHVGRGSAEAACKTVVSTRAKRTGMCWTPEGLDAVLAVRTAVLNESYDTFCEQHPLLWLDYLQLFHTPKLLGALLMYSKK
ncbi:MAG: hypothetical protein NVSMB38_36120 [Ktedonobacteraceae bacterium]